MKKLIIAAALVMTATMGANAKKYGTTSRRYQYWETAIPLMRDISSPKLMTCGIGKWTPTTGPMCMM